jgi:hypothetical protein
MAIEAQARHEQQVAEEKHKQAEHIAAKEITKAEGKAKTDESLELCDEGFKGFTLQPMGHEVHVGVTSACRMFNIRDDGGEYFHLSVSRNLRNLPGVREIYAE